MQAITLLLTTLLAAVATATYTGPGAAQCAVGNTVACCDTAGGDGILGNVLAGSCDIPNLLSISNNCIAGNTFCCPVDQSGQLNVAAACVPISA